MAADSFTKRSLSYDGAKGIIALAIKQAKKHDRNVAIIVLDPDGEQIAVARMDGAKPVALDIATQKAKTSLLFRQPSRIAAGLLKEGNLSILSLSDISGFPGGLPIKLDGEVIGAIGVSGAPADIDEKIAEAGLKRFSD